MRMILLTVELLIFLSGLFFLSFECFYSSSRILSIFVVTSFGETHKRRFFYVWWNQVPFSGLPNHGRNYFLHLFWRSGFHDLKDLFLVTWLWLIRLNQVSGVTSLKPWSILNVCIMSARSLLSFCKSRFNSFNFSS